MEQRRGLIPIVVVAGLTVVGLAGLGYMAVRPDPEIAETQRALQAAEEARRDKIGHATGAVALGALAAGQAAQALAARREERVARERAAAAILPPPPPPPEPSQMREETHEKKRLLDRAREWRQRNAEPK